jgi:hypothetical protein
VFGSGSCRPGERLAPAAFQSLGALPRVGQKMSHRTEQIRTKSAPLGIHHVQTLPRKQAGEEFLCQIARGVLIGRSASDEGKHRGIIGCAQIAQRRLGFRRIAAGLQHPRPLCGDECGGRFDRVLFAG